MIKVYFAIEKLEVGKFKTGSFVVDNTTGKPGLVMVEVPNELVDNADFVVDVKADPILTLEGLHYVYCKLHDAMTFDPDDLTSAYAVQKDEDDEFTDDSDTDNDWEF